MKTIGLIGGISWQSSVTYYQVINRKVNGLLGGSHSAKVLMYSVDFDEVSRMQHEGRWDDFQQLLIDAAKRPMTLIRFPQGTAEKGFFQKHDTGSFGPDVKHIPIEEKDGETEDYLYFDDIKGLLACVQMGTIEFHGWGSRVDKVEYPDRLVFDLDPDVGLDFGKVKEAAVLLRELLQGLGLESWPLLSGGKGIHVVVPLDASEDWPTVKSFAERFSRAISEAEPDIFTANIRKEQRKGRIFLDWLRNQRGATAVMPYSARGREGAPVSAPVAWNELDQYLSGGHFSIRDADELLKRAKSKRLAGWGKAEQALPPF